MIAVEGKRQLKDQYPHLFNVDSQLNRLVQRIELLAYVNPLNIEKEKQRFFASKYTYQPQFKYPKLKFDPYKLQRLFFAQRLEKIEDEYVAKLYKEVIYYYANMIQCIETIGSSQQFYYNSLRVYGTPTERDVQNAQFILHYANEAEREDLQPRYSAMEAKSYFEEFVEQYDFPLNIKFSTHIAAEAMVSNCTRELFLKRNTKFSKNQLLTLGNHEIGVHLVTTFNGLEQPLKIFSNGLPNNVETQEGLAVFSEYMGGALTLKRLKELSYRVLATDSISKGFDFADTFNLIHGQYRLDRDAAFGITLRAHRGGGLTKDRLYLSGLRKIYKRYKAGKDLDILFTGKVALDFEEEMKYLQDKGLLLPIKHKCLSLQSNLNRNSTLDFILDNLK